MLVASAAIACGGAVSSKESLPAISAGSGHTCALTIAGAVKCWGYNEKGQLGDGATTDRHTPVGVSGLASGVTAIASGGRHTCALTSAGAVKCWGGNGYGQLGDRTTIERHKPVDVSGLASGVTAIASGGRHTCALTSAAGVKCWGFNDNGQLGDGTTSDRHAPVAVSGLASDVTAIAAAGRYTCALTSAGEVKCWGENHFSQLGDGTEIDRHTPVAVSGLASGVTAITAGVSHSCALTSAGGVKCWGDNFAGQLGDGTTSWRYKPVDVAGLADGVTAIAAGLSQSCALTSAGGVKCWGWNDTGQLGDGTTAMKDTPVAVSGLPAGVQVIVAGDRNTCALTSAGGVKCWGYNRYGQLGDGTTTERHRPVGVVGFGASPPPTK